MARLATILAVGILSAACSRNGGLQVFQVTLSNPQLLQLGVALDAVLEITFNRDLDPLTVTVAAGPVPGTVTVTNTRTGESVTGTVMVDGNKITFTPTDPLEDDQTYAFKVSGDVTDMNGNDLGGDSLVVFGTGAGGKTSAEGRHLFNAGRPKLLTDIMYDVDTRRSYGLDYLRDAIENAQARADAANVDWDGQQNTAPLLGGRSKFHFWPNIVNLTEVYFLDRALYDRIVAEFLEREPTRDTVIPALAAAAARGERIFLARDFLLAVFCEFEIFLEVNYGFLLNLDALTIDEYLVHQAEGLPAVRDPRADDLRDVFADPGAASLGEVWDLCLRGNLDRRQMEAIVVDKLDEDPNAEFYVRRIDQVCIAIPEPPHRPPPEDPPPPPPPPPPDPPDPGPVLTTPPPPVNPDEPKPGKDADDIPGEGPIPIPEGSSDEDPQEGDPDSMPANTDPTCATGEDLQGIKDELAACEDQLEVLRECFAADIRQLNAFGYDWLDAPTFKSPDLNMAYDSLNDEAQMLKAEIQALCDDLETLNEERRTTLTTTSGPIRAFLGREDIWDAVIYTCGPWQNVTVPCMPPVIPAGGNPIEGALDPDGVPILIVVSVELQSNFQLILTTHMMRGKSIDEAGDATIADPRVYPPGMEFCSIWQLIWKAYVDCLKRLYSEMLRTYFLHYYPDLTDAELDQMADIMLCAEGDESKLNATQMEELQGVEDAIADNQAQADAKQAEKNAKKEELRGLLAEFWDLATTWEEGARKAFSVKLAEIMLLQDYIAFCKSGGSVITLRMPLSFCDAINQLLGRGGAPPALQQTLLGLQMEFCGGIVDLPGG